MLGFSDEIIDITHSAPETEQTLVGLVLGHCLRCWDNHFKVAQYNLSSLPNTASQLITRKYGSASIATPIPSTRFRNLFHCNGYVITWTTHTPRGPTYRTVFLQHCAKWQIHPFISKATIYLKSKKIPLRCLVIQIIQH